MVGADAIEVTVITRIELRIKEILSSARLKKNRVSGSGRVIMIRPSPPLPGNGINMIHDTFLYILKYGIICLY